MSILDQLRHSILKKITRRKVPATLFTEEKDRIDELRSHIRQLETPETVDSEAERTWMENCTQLRQMILENDPREFLNWKVVRETMFFVPHISELKYLQKLHDWKYWKKALKESCIGNPPPYYAFRATSGTLIHHAYSLSQLTTKFNCSIENMSRIFEFGGGYGSMCRLIYQLGFKGHYIIYDLPEFSALQKYFLKSTGIFAKVNKERTFEQSVAFITDLNDLERQSRDQTDMFIATWSISESGEKLRQRIFGLVDNPSYYLIAYQDHFSEVNNREYFSRFAAARRDYEWFDYAIPQLPGHRYLIGKRSITA